MPLIEKVETFCNIVLQTPQTRVAEIIYGIQQNPDNFYDSFTRPKKDKLGHKIPGKGRPINPPKDELKAIQKRINRYIVNSIPFPGYVYGAVNHKDNITNARVHKGNKYVLTTDLHDFFTRVKHKDVYNALICLGFVPEIARAITILTTYKGHLPQGGPASTTLANHVFAFKVGWQIEQITAANGLRFTTFVDDITVSGSVDFKETAQEIIDLIKANFPISNKKTHYKTSPSEVTGVKLYNNHLEPTDKTFERLSDKNLPESTIKGLELYKQRVRAISKVKTPR